jgi:hypothetical protein
MEARDVQSRMNFTPDQRASVTPVLAGQSKGLLFKQDLFDMLGKK